MDYNDNEFQSQNTELVGEDNSKFPPGVRSYALPKYDLDEHLQVHLRFDSLVEAEILLGIQNQEENHWIEDYSRGSSGILVLDPVSQSIESESCSISRPNNVWSEATSSESVEMLLNSVGQDVMITEQSIIEVPNACDIPLDSLNDQMDPNVTQNDSIPTDTGDILGADPVQSPNPCPEGSSGLIKDAAGDLACEPVLESHEVERTVYESFFDKDQSSVHEKSGIYEKFTDSSLDHNMGSFVDAGTEHMLIRGDYNEESEVQGINPELQKDNLVMEVPLDDRFLGKDAVGSHCSSVSREGIENPVSADFESMRGDDPLATPLQMVEQNDQDLPQQMTKRSDDVLFFEKPEALLEDDDHQLESEISGTGTAMDDHYIGSIGGNPSVEMEGNQNHPDEIRDQNARNPSCLVTEMDRPHNGTHEAEEKLHIKEGHNSLEIHAQVYVGDLESVLSQKKSPDKMKNDIGGPDVILNDQEDIVLEQASGSPDSHGCGIAEVDVSTFLCEKSLQTCDKGPSDVGTGVDNIIHSDVSIPGKECTKLSQDSAVAEDDTDGSVVMEKVEGLSQGQCTETTSVAQGPYAEKSKRDNSGITETLVGDAQSSQDTDRNGSFLTVPTGSVPGPVSGDITSSTSFIDSKEVRRVVPVTKLIIDEAIEQKEVEGLHSPVADCVLLDEKKESVSEDPKESCSLVLQQNIECQTDSGSHLVSDGAKGSYHTSAAEQLPESVAYFSASTHKSVLEGCHDSVTGEKDCCEVSGVSSERYEAKSLPVAGDPPDQNEESSCKPENTEPIALEPGSDAMDSVEADCGSPIVISCSESSQCEMEYQGDDKKSSDQNGAVSGALSSAPSDVDGKVDKFESAFHDPGNDASENDKSFTFEVGSLAVHSAKESSSFLTGTNGKGWKPFSNIQPIESPQSGKNSPITPGLYQPNQRALDETPHGSQVSNEQKAHGVSKDLSADKKRSVVGSGGDRGTVVEGKHVKERSRAKRKAATFRDDGNLCSALASSCETLPSRAMQVEEIQQCVYVEGTTTKPYPVTPVQTSSLPDLNASAAPTLALFQQPFTDLQQVQLRAQIFVYGSLIQGAAPDEACMVSAFGESGRDGGRSVWENVWRVAVERFHNQKSPLNNPETPLHSRSGVRVPEHASRCNSIQNKTPGTPAGRTGMKGAPSPAVLNPAISISSPVWSMSTPSREGVLPSGMARGSLLDSHQSLAPLHLYHSPHARHYVGTNTPWSSQPQCPGPWIVSPQTSALDAGPQYSTLPTVETVQVTSVRDHSGVPSIQRPPSVQLVSPSPLPSTVGSVTSPAGTGVPVEGRRTPATPGRNPSADQKSRKRKKGLVSEEVGPKGSVLQCRTESPYATNVVKHLPTSVGITSPGTMAVFSPGPASKVTGGVVSTSSAVTAPMHYQIISGGNSEQRVTLSEETFSRIEQAKLQAEDAAALAATAVRHSQGIWSQLAIQKNSGLLSEVEANMASAAVTAAAAASVAKAAAAASKVACDAALQAKLLAGEALNLTKMGNSSRGVEIGLTEGRKNLEKVTMALILKGKDKLNSSSSVIAMAREAARKRVEAASAAAKRAENLDAVVKAAELAAEAVSQAYAVIGMGDPIPLTLNELVEAGPEGYWKIQQANSIQMVEHSSVDVSAGGQDGASKSLKERLSSMKEAQRSNGEGKLPPAKDLSKQSVKSPKEFVNGMRRDSVTTEKGLEGKRSRKASDLAKTIGVVPESEIGSKVSSLSAQNDEYERDNPVGPSNENSILEGSLVEVVSDEEGLRGVWFSAKVLSLKDRKAFVCYKEILSDEGPGQLKEWIPLEGEGDKPPRIRNAHPMTAMKFEGTRKRRREAMGNHVWSVGDRVDTWMRDGWWEGIIAEKHKDDETKLTVHFPVEGDSSVVRTWNLRPSLIWKDGQWVEWSRSGEKNCWPCEGDAPQDKRQKLGNLETNTQVEVRGKEKLSKDFYFDNSKKPEESRPLALSGKEKIFTAGKTFKEDNNSATLRVKRTGLQKEGSKVVFGVPKPGKKRKFMDVSKHYVADGAGKTSEGNDSIKFTQYLMRQRSRGLKNNSKVDVKGKRVTDSKPELKLGKSQSIQSKSRFEKDSSYNSVVSTSSEATGMDPLPSTKVSIGHEESKLQKPNTLEAGCYSNILKPAEGPVLFSSLELRPDVPPSRKKFFSVVDSEQGLKGKLGPAGGKLNADEEIASVTNDIPEKSVSDAIEPRRSNRRIQPTSRLLEGLQSSPIILKASTISHDKTSRAQHRNASSLKGNNRG